MHHLPLHKALLTEGKRFTRAVFWVQELCSFPKNNMATPAPQQPAPATLFPVAPGVWGIKDIFVNVYLVATSSSGNWVLVDTGLKTAAKKIREAAAALFGTRTRPDAIVLTHAHFDHTGSLQTLLNEWLVPVYAHRLEAPYLTGRSSYPPPDPTVGGGLMTLLSFLYPSRPIDVSNHLLLLPEDGRIPVLPGWEYILTPGHAPGHVSLYRRSDGVLLAGDAFVTTRQESAFDALTQRLVLSGPPRYFTYDWKAAEQSVKKLAALQPVIAATGHGKPMQGTSMQEALQALGEQFKEKAVPSNGRYVAQPAIVNAAGVEYVPPAPPNRSWWPVAGAVALAALATVLLVKKYQAGKRAASLE